MHIQNQIVTTLPFFKVSDTMKMVIKFFEETTFSHIAVVDGDIFEFEIVNWYSSLLIHADGFEAFVTG